MQSLNGGVAGNNKIGVVAEPLQASIPNISIDILIGFRGHAKEFNVPYDSHNESNDDNVSGKFLSSEKLTNRQEICDACESQRGHEVRPAPIGEIT